MTFFETGESMQRTSRKAHPMSTARWLVALVTLAALLGSACSATTADEAANNEGADSGGDGESNSAAETGSDTAEPLRVELAMISLWEPEYVEAALQLVDDFATSRSLVLKAEAIDDPFILFDEDCSAVIGDNPADVLITDHSNGPELDCYTELGIPVITMAEQHLDPAYVQARPNAFSPASATLDDVRKAIGAGIQADPTAAEANKIAVLASAAFFDPDVWDASVQTFADQLAEDIGVETATYYIPPNDDSPSWDAEMATLPVRMKEDGIGAIISLPGGDPVFLDFFTSQGFEIPVFQSVSDVASFQLDYPAESFNLYSFSKFNLGSADLKRAFMEETDAGRECLQLIDRGGQDAEDELVTSLAMVCAALQVAASAVEAEPGAFDSVESLTAAFDTAGPILLPTGDVADLTDGRQLGAANFTYWAGNAECNCVLPVE
jgi:hypothetical protein